MSSEMQPRPVVLFQPVTKEEDRQYMDFRPLPVKEEEADADPKVLSVPESAPSSPSEQDPPSTPSPPVLPVPTALVEKGNTQPKENGNSTPTS